MPDASAASGIPLPIENDREPDRVRVVSSRYCDQPMALDTRLAGIGGVGAIATIIVCGLLFSWTVFREAKPASHLSVFNVAPPAAPPQPVSKTPPGPKRVQKDQAQTNSDRPVVPPVQIQLPGEALPLMPPAKPVPDPGPPVKEVTQPEPKPEPPAPQQSNARPTWEGLVLGALGKVRRYPRDAALRHQQGVPYIRFTMDRQGKVLSVALDRSSGIRALDLEALALPKRAQPLPKPPEDVKGDVIELAVPVEFFLR